MHENTSVITIYRKFLIFREDFTFINIVKRNIFDVENFQMGHDLLESVNDWFISPFRDCFIFAKFR